MFKRQAKPIHIAFIKRLYQQQNRLRPYILSPEHGFSHQKDRDDSLLMNRRPRNLIRFKTSYPLHKARRIPNTIQTDTTNGAVSVVIPKLIPQTCKRTEITTDNVAHAAPAQERSPKAMAQSTALYPNKPALKAA